MFTTRLQLLFFLMLFFLNGKSQQAERAFVPVSECNLAVNGTIIYKGEEMKQFKVLVYLDDSLYCFTEVTKKKVPEIYLVRNKKYTLIINKDGFYPKKLEIDSNAPETTDGKSVAKISFQAEMTPIENFISNKFIWDIPFARIRYDLKQGKFRFVKSQIIKDNEYHFPD